MLLVVPVFGAAGVAAVQFLVALVVVAPLYLLALHRIRVQAGSVLRAVILPSVAGASVWLASWSLARAGIIPFFAAGTAALVAVAVMGGLAYWQRDNLRLLRLAARQDAT